MAVGKLKAQGLADTNNVVLSAGVTIDSNAVLSAMRAADEEKKKAKAAKK